LFACGHSPADREGEVIVMNSRILNLWADARGLVVMAAEIALAAGSNLAIALGEWTHRNR
jgi:hypothetical protein